MSALKAVSNLIHCYGALYVTRKAAVYFQTVAVTATHSVHTSTLAVRGQEISEEQAQNFLNTLRPAVRQGAEAATLQRAELEREARELRRDCGDADLWDSPARGVRR